MLDLLITHQSATSDGTSNCVKECLKGCQMKHGNQSGMMCDRQYQGRMQPEA